MGQYAEAEALHKQSLSIKERKLGPEHLDVAIALTALADTYRALDRDAEAERILQRALTIREKKLPGNHELIGASLHNLALVYNEQGRYEEAERLLKRSLLIDQRLRPDHPRLGTTFTNLAGNYTDQGRYSEAEPLYRRGLAIRRKAYGNEHPMVAQSLARLASLQKKQGNLVEADRLFTEALAIREKVLGSEHPVVASTLVEVAELRRAGRRFEEAEPLYLRSLAIREKTMGAMHPVLVHSLQGLGRLRLDQRRIDDALVYLRRATAMRAAASATQADGAKERPAGRKEDRAIFTQLASATWLAAAANPAKRDALAREAFEALQNSARDVTGFALEQMAARFGAGTAVFAQRVRERQDASRLREALSKSLIKALSESGPKRSEALIGSLRHEIAATEAKVKQLSEDLEHEFPAFAELLNPKPLQIADVQRLLAPSEALIAFMVGDASESFVWVITRERSVWQLLPADSKAIEEKIAILRKGVDQEDLKAAAATGTLFDLGQAGELYQILLGGVAEAIKSKAHLIVVPSGPLTSLPFQLLVADRPPVARPSANQLSAYRDAGWLIKRHAISVLPSVSSLKALRALAGSATAARPIVAFGDPVFRPASAGGRSPSGQGGPAQRRVTRSFGNFWKGSDADLEALRAGLSPLPETAEEVRSVAKALGAGSGDLHIGEAASETTVKRLDLAPYRIVYFATHGLVAGELRGLAEPALALTLPLVATEIDDGLLTASEVAQLKLNADWVVLSACNTAAGDRPGAEALSGLARAFFYAGARALLVSHWRIDSEAAVRLTTSTFASLQKQPSIGRAEALRRAMLAMTEDTSSPWNAYPDYWAAFSVVGEGGK